MRGTMIYFNEEKDVGFIRTDAGDRVQVIRGDFLDQAPVGRCSGRVVEFRLRDDVAVEVALIVEDVPRRARRHRR